MTIIEGAVRIIIPFISGSLGFWIGYRYRGYVARKKFKGDWEKEFAPYRFMP